MPLLSTHNNCFCEEIKKYQHFLVKNRHLIWSCYLLLLLLLSKLFLLLSMLQSFIHSVKPYFLWKKKKSKCSLLQFKSQYSVLRCEKKGPGNYAVQSWPSLCHILQYQQFCKKDNKPLSDCTNKKTDLSPFFAEVLTTFSYARADSKGVRGFSWTLFRLKISFSW